MLLHHMHSQEPTPPFMFFTMPSAAVLLQVRRAARDELRRGAHCLKVMASGGVASPTDRSAAHACSLLLLHMSRSVLYQRGECGTALHCTCRAAAAG